MSSKWKFRRPKRHQLSGMSCSELKGLLRRTVGPNRIRRNFFGWQGAVFQWKNRMYRIRWSAPDECMVDVSCEVADFDRWANSCEDEITLSDLVNRLRK